MDKNNRCERQIPRWIESRNVFCIQALSICLVFFASNQAFSETPSKSISLKQVTGLDGQTVDLKLNQGQALALVFYSTQCPIANASCETLAQLAQSFPAEKIRFVGVCVDPDLTEIEVANHAKDFSLQFPVVQDKSGRLARQFGAKVTPEAFVVDHSGAIRYQGRIDDQFAGRQKRNLNPQNHEFKDALVAMCSGKNIAIAYTQAVGCPLPDPQPENQAPAPTYAREISRMIQKNCQECHSKGQIGPFPLETYEHARKRASDLASVTAERSMPPWKAERGFGMKMKHDQSLSEDEIQAFADWADAGAPLGDISEMPAAVTFPTGWKLGTPDLVLQLPEGYEIPATGPDLYRCFVIPTNLPKDMYVSAIDFKPDNRTVVHHITSWVDNSGEGRKKDEMEPGPGYISFVGAGVKTHSDLGGWAAGRSPTVLPEGIGYSMPANSDVILQMHYHPSGKVERDRSQVGLYFSRKPIRTTMQRTSAINDSFAIPAGAKNQEVQAQWVIPVDVVAYGVSPHMHLIGKSMKMSATFPDGRVTNLIHVPIWDFNWQMFYEFEEPLDLPKGTIVKVVAHYDNSAQNKSNPNSPPKEVKWGPATYDEMCVGFITVTKKGQDLTRPGEKNDLNEMIRNSQREQKAKSNRLSQVVE